MPFIDTGDNADSGSKTAGSALGVHRALLEQEKRKYEARGGRLALVNGKAVVSPAPGPLLRALRAGEPVELIDWQLPKWARPGRVRNVRVRVHPGGRIEEV